MFCVNRLCVLNASLTCYAVFSLLCCLPPVVCVDVFMWWMCHIVSHVSPSAFHNSSLMFVVQCFVSVCFCPLPSLASLPSPLSPISSLSHTRCTSTYNITCTCACMHTHTPLACHLVGSLISSSLVVFAPSFSVFNSPSYPPFLALSIVDHDLTRQNLASSPFFLNANTGMW